MLHAEVIGRPIGHSKSPLIHNFWIAAIALPRTYSAREIARSELASYLAERRTERSWLGCNVTMPLKPLAAELVDDLSPAARKTGAVNLIVRKRELLIGHNVDREGFLESVEPALGALDRRHALVVGCGGAAAAIVYALCQRGFRVDCLARNPDRAGALLRAMGADRGRALALERGLPRQDGPALLVNATPLGMRGFGELELDLSPLHAGSFVCDIVYEPVETGLIASARRRGLEAIDGLGMLIGQAALSFELLFGTAPPRSRDHELRELLAG